MRAHQYKGVAFRHADTVARLDEAVSRYCVPYGRFSVDGSPRSVFWSASGADEARFLRSVAAFEWSERLSCAPGLVFVGVDGRNYLLTQPEALAVACFFGVSPNLQWIGEEALCVRLGDLWARERQIHAGEGVGDGFDGDDGVSFSRFLYGEVLVGTAHELAWNQSECERAGMSDHHQLEVLVAACGLLGEGELERGLFGVGDDRVDLLEWVYRMPDGGNVTVDVALARVVEMSAAAAARGNRAVLERVWRAAEGIVERFSTSPAWHMPGTMRDFGGDLDVATGTVGALQAAFSQLQYHAHGQRSELRRYRHHPPRRCHRDHPLN